MRAQVRATYSFVPPATPVGSKEYPLAESTIHFYGAAWCRDCRRAKQLLESLGASFTYHDLEKDEAAAARAVEISGQKHIPVVQFSDGTFLVEPTNMELTGKVKALGLIR